MGGAESLGAGAEGRHPERQVTDKLALFINSLDANSDAQVLGMDMSASTEARVIWKCPISMPAEVWCALLSTLFLVFRLSSASLETSPREGTRHHSPPTVPLLTLL